MWTPTKAMLESIGMEKYDNYAYGIQIENKWHSSPWINYRKQWMSRQWNIYYDNEDDDGSAIIPFYPKGLDQVKTMIRLLTKD